MTSGGRDGSLQIISAILGAMLLAGIILGWGSAEAQQVSEPILRSLKTFVHNGRAVRIEEFRPTSHAASTDDGCAAVILLHGASGIRRGTLIYRQAQALAENGIAAYVLHYYDGMKGRGRINAGSAKYDERTQIIESAIGFIQKTGPVAEKRIGLWGYSLGAFHALGLASRDRRIGAVAAVAGGMPRHIARDGVEAMPPTLIVHGGRDRVVPVHRARNTAAILDEIGADYVIDILKSEAHVLKGRALTGTIEKVTSFFGERLAARAHARRMEMSVEIGEIAIELASAGSDTNTAAPF